MSLETICVSDAELLKIAAPIMDNLMDGSTERDWDKHTLNFTDGAKASLSKENLLRQCDEYQSTFGNFAQREFVGITRHPKYVNVIWTQRMTKSEGEYMAILTLVQHNKEIYVIRCWVDLWEPR